MVIVRVVRTLIDHKKKSVFFGVTGFFGAKWIKNWADERRILREYCMKASKYGHEPISPEINPRKVTVLINTRAHDGKAKSYFEKYALPLLLLAGLQVDTIQPSDDTKMREYAELMDVEEADALFIVGGDSTLSKVTTGCLNRLLNAKTNNNNNNCNKIVTPLPVGVFPGGHLNTAMHRFYPDDILFVHKACQSAMDLIQENVTNIPAIKVNVDAKEPEYAMSHVRIGSQSVIDKLQFKYWYWGGLKGKFAAIRYSLFNVPAHVENMQINYGEVCMGCCKCRPVEKIDIPIFWYHSLIGKPTPPKHENEKYLDVVNEKCGMEISGQFDTADLVVRNKSKPDSPELFVDVGVKELGKLAFLGEMFARDKSDDRWHSNKNDYYQLQTPCSSANLEFKQANEENPVTIYIDGEPIEATKSVSIKTSYNYSLPFYISKTA